MHRSEEDIQNRLVGRISREIGGLREIDLEVLVSILSANGIRGVPSDCRSCPVAEHLNRLAAPIDEQGVFHVLVQPGEIQLVRADNHDARLQVWPSPPVVEEFVEQFDRMGRVFVEFDKKQRKILLNLVSDRLRDADGDEYGDLDAILTELSR